MTVFLITNIFLIVNNVCHFFFLNSHPLTLTTSILVALASTAQNGSRSPLAILFPARCLEILPHGVFCGIIRNADTDFFVAPWLIFSVLLTLIGTEG